MTAETVNNMWVFYSLASCCVLSYGMGVFMEDDDNPMIYLICTIIAIGIALKLIEVMICS